MSTEETELTFIRCPSCRSLVPAVANRCRMCGFIFEDSAGASVAPTPPPPEEPIVAPMVEASEPPPPEPEPEPELEPEPSFADEPEPDSPPTERMKRPTVYSEVVENTEPLSFSPSRLKSTSEEEVRSFISPEEPLTTSDHNEVDVAISEPVVDEPVVRPSELSDPVVAEPILAEPVTQVEEPVMKVEEPVVEPTPVPQVTLPIESIPIVEAPTTVVNLEEQAHEPEVVSSPEPQHVEISQPPKESTMENRGDSFSQTDMSNGVDTIQSSAVQVNPEHSGHLVGWLVNFSQNEKGAGLEIRSGRFFIGNQRLRDGDIVISDSAVSTPHCLVQATRGSFQVQDLMSEQGTFVKRRGTDSFVSVVNPIKLAHGDILRLGSYEVTVILIP